MILIISGVSLIVSKWNDSSINKRIQDACTSIKIYSSHDNVSTELSFSIAYDYNDYYFINIELGDDVWLYVNGAVMFSGKITDIKFDSETNTHEITCYDIAWYICKNNITYNFEDVSVNDAITYVISELEIERYDYDKELQGNGNIRIGNHLIKNQPANKVLMAICGEITKLKGIYYYIHMNQNGRVVISECDKYYSGITIQKSSANVVDGNLISYTISKSMQNMVNQVKLYSPEYELLDTFNTIGFNRRQFGIIQDTEMLDTGDDNEADSDDDYKKNYSTTGIFSKAVEKIKQRLEKEGKPEVDLSVVCLGDVNYKVGYGVMVRLPETVYNDVFCYITAVEHNFTSDGNFISKLTLSLSKHQELVEWEDIEEKREEDEEDIGAEGGSTNSIIESACQWAVKIAEDDTHGYSQARRWSGIDFDCSSFVISAFEQAGLKLRENGANTTYDMIKGFRACGFEDIHNFTQSDLVRGDVLLNVDHHTCLYIGDGKVANCSSDRGHPEAGDQDGTEIRIQDYYVYPEGGWNCILRLKKVDTDKTTVRGDSSIDSAVNANSPAEFAKIVAPFAKELYKTYHIFPSTIISCMIQESWDNGFTRLAKNHFNFGGVKCSASSENAVQDYKPPASEGSMLYRHFNTLKEFMTYWCELISGRTGMNVYKVNIADKNTAKEQCYGFDNTPYAGDKSKGGQMWSIVQRLALEQYNQ